jgi:hypothetical protein
MKHEIVYSENKGMYVDFTLGEVWESVLQDTREIKLHKDEIEVILEALSMIHDIQCTINDKRSVETSKYSKLYYELLSREVAGRVYHYFPIKKKIDEVYDIKNKEFICDKNSF